MVSRRGPLQVSPEIEQQHPGADHRATAVAINLIRAQGLVSGRIGSYLRRFDLTVATFNVLMILDGADGALCPHEIGDRLLVTRGTVTGLLDSLERRGLITRGPHAEDRRMVSVSITAQGSALLRELLPGHLANEAEMLDGLSDREKDTLLRLLGKIQDGLAP